MEDGGADYSAAYKAHKKEFGIKTERKGAAMGQHLLVDVKLLEEIQNKLSKQYDNDDDREL